MSPARCHTYPAPHFAVQQGADGHPAPHFAVQQGADGLTTFEAALAGHSGVQELGGVAPPQHLSFLDSLAQCDCFKRTGVVLCWWVLAGVALPVLDSITIEIRDSWFKPSSVPTSLNRGRARGSTFPIREGDLGDFACVFRSLSFGSAVSSERVEAHWADAWLYLALRSLNGLYGTAAGLEPGRWTLRERRAASSVRAAVLRKGEVDMAASPMTAESWQNEMKGRQIGYNGEEITTCHSLTWEQVIPSLPPETHGGCIEAVDWVNSRTREFLLNPKLLLKDPAEVQLPRMPGKIHIDPADRVRIAQELVRRNICDWVPLSQVYHVGSTPILNGLFGVAKPTLLENRLPVLRLIMNLVGANATQFQLSGGTSSLPSITSWQSIVVDQGEHLEINQSDMSSAFYLFKLPAVWKRYLCFNLVVNPADVGCSGSEPLALACTVIPMGWLSSVGIMQEISENILKAHNLDPRNQVLRGRALPPWFSDILEHAFAQDRHWWHIYLDNFCMGERIDPLKPSDRGRLCHAAAERAWESAGVLSSEKKRVSAATRAVELGAETDGTLATLGVSTEKLVKVIQATLWLCCQRLINRKVLQIIAGRWIFILQFRRPGMAFLEKTWIFIGGKQRITQKLRQQVRGELLTLIGASPLLHCFLGGKVSKQVLVSDASEKGGAVAFADELTDEGRDFLQATQKIERFGGIFHLPILVISLFNGIGGCFRCYDIAGVCPKGRIAVELDQGANRITQRRWPGTLIVNDIRSVTRSVVREWSLTYLDIEEVHLWGGFPCTDLSAVKFNRKNLAGSQSSLYWEIPRVEKLVADEFGPTVKIKKVLENVSSMDRSAAEEITQDFGFLPYKLDCCQAVPMRRPRFAWTTERLEGLLPDVFVSAGPYFKEVIAEAEYPATKQWITPGYSWQGESSGAIFPTAMKSIPRNHPPPRPAGLEKCDWDCRQRWFDDFYRYPPYQYKEEFLITSTTTWRLLSADEKELLLGYGFKHTSVAWSASKQKANQTAYSDARHSYLGDSFSIYSFVLLAVACCRGFIPSVPYQFLVKRMGMCPGFLAHFRSAAPLQRSLSYGSVEIQGELFNKGVEWFNRLLLRRTNHTGSDIRVISGDIMNAKCFPRQSVSAQWWKWQALFNHRWKTRSHINVLEMETILWGVRQQINRFKAGDARVFHLTDSYVSMSVISKGRSSSYQLQRVVRRINAELLAHGLQLILAHVESTDNPTDEGSRL